jgi:ribosome biogenesis GTPase
VVVQTDNKQQFLCSLRGALKQDKTRMKNLIAIGDFVRFVIDGSLGSIVQIEERKSLLSRADNLSRQKEQLIAVNVDQVLITTSIVSPVLKPSLVDRYIIAAMKGNMQPVIIINKIDLLDNPPEGIDPQIVEEQRALYHEFVRIYESLCIPVIAVSATKGVGIERLKEIMRNKSSVFSGQSGVGKSSLINTAYSTDFEIGKVVDKTQKGSHTTTTSQLIPLENDGFCIDTPGIKSFGLFDLEKEEIVSYFSEILEAGCSCKFPDCSHLQEPGCQVQNLVEQGIISSLRFGSYSALMKSLSEDHRHR